MFVLPTVLILLDMSFNLETHFRSPEGLSAPLQCAFEPHPVEKFLFFPPLSPHSLALG